MSVREQQLDRQLVDHLSRRPSAADLEAGARNLLANCVGLRAGETLLIVGEGQSDAWFRPEVSTVIAEVAVGLGAVPKVILAREVRGPEDLPRDLLETMRTADHTVFLSRLGDQVRFSGLPGSGSKTMCALYDTSYLGDAFARVPHGVFEEVSSLLLARLAGKRHCRITCPEGTDLEGGVPAADGGQAPTTQDFTVAYFPTMITPPLSAAGLTGRLALSRWLMSTSTHAYDESLLTLRHTLCADVERGRIRCFHGEASEVARVERHFERVAGLFGGEAFALNSWHCGINPRTFYAASAEDDIDKWSSMVYGSPRYTHFHACGRDPGDIAISLFDATISFDGEDFWEGGRFVFLERPEVRRILECYPGSEGAYDMRWDIGI